MAKQDNLLDRMRIASPCPMSWEKMTGDDAARFCEQCQLHVYNISQMTWEQAENLLARTEGRVCARLYRRADGTVLTKDCPVGLRALRRRARRVAGAALTTLLGLAASVLGQTPLARTGKSESIGGGLIAHTAFLGSQPQEGRATFWGVIRDPQGSTVEGAEATILNEKTKYKRTIKSDRKGLFKFGLLEPGLYTIEIESMGFEPYRRAHVSLHSNDDLRYDISLDIAGAMVGIVVIDEPRAKGMELDGVHVRIN